jgi:hypothetical protein
MPVLATSPTAVPLEHRGEGGGAGCCPPCLRADRVVGQLCLARARGAAVKDGGGSTLNAPLEHHVNHLLIMVAWIEPSFAPQEP